MKRLTPLKPSNPDQHFAFEEAEDLVEMDSMDSFPCSDPPGWIKVIAHKPCPYGDCPEA